jgi:hypothetical protein
MLCESEKYDDCPRQEDIDMKTRSYQNVPDEDDLPGKGGCEES